jgi:hypothetical protein
VGVGKWSSASRQLVVPHRWGTRLGVWSRPPAQTDPLARRKPGIDVAFPPLSSVSILTVKTIPRLLLPLCVLQRVLLSPPAEVGRWLGAGMGGWWCTCRKDGLRVVERHAGASPAPPEATCIVRA